MSPCHIFEVTLVKRGISDGLQAQLRAVLLRPSIFSFLICAVLSAGTASAASARLGTVTVPTESGTSRTLSLRLWVPDNTAGAKVRGILVACHPSGTEGSGFQQDYRPLAENPQATDWVETTTTEWDSAKRMDLAMQLVATRHNFAVVGLYFSGQKPGGAGPGQVSMMPAHAAALEAGISLLASTYSRPELATAPIATYGFSGGSGFSLFYAAYNPARCIAVAHNKGGSVGDYDPVAIEPAEQVPVMLSYGELDTPNIEKVKGVFNYHRARGALWFLIPDYGLAHDAQGYGRFFGAAFFDRVIEMRMPHDWVPGTAPVLKPLIEAAGWLGDHSSWETARSTIVAFSANTGTLAEKRTVSWLPDQVLAEAWRAVTTHLPAEKLSSPVSSLETTLPKQLAFLTAGGSQALGLTSAGGNVSSVEWKDGGLSAGSFASPPFSKTLSTLTPGFHLVHGDLQLTGGGSSTTELAILLVKPPTTNQVPSLQSGPTIPGGPIYSTLPIACSALASDPDGSIEELLTYTWSATGPGTVLFTPANSTNAGKQITATFPVPGTYQIRVTVKDSIGSSAPVSSANLPITVTAPPLFNTWISSHNLIGNDAAESAKPAGDGITNLVKYSLNLDPHVPSVTPTDGLNPGLPLVTIGAGVMTLLYQKDTAKTDLTYVVEASPDLANWDTSGVVESIQSIAGYRQTIQATVSLGSDPQKFIRLKVSK